MSRGNHGGARDGAGRKPGSGAYGEPTEVLRVPSSYVPMVRGILAELRAGRPPGTSAALSPQPRPLPYFTSPRAQAGFPSPAAEAVDEPLDLNQLLVVNPPSTFFTRVAGDSMIDAGIFDGDLAVVDRSIEPRPGKIVVAAADGDLYIKRLRRLQGRLALVSENAARAAQLPPRFLDGFQECILWGVVTGTVRQFR